MDKIIIKDLKLYAYHGVNPEEKVEGQNFLIDMECKVDLSLPCVTDNVDDTVSYAQIIKLVRKVFTCEKYDLIEKAAQVIADAVLDNFERSLNIPNPTDEVAAVLKGNKMIFDQLMNVLKKNGLEIIEAQGKEFDPNFHQAVMMVEDENYESNIVLEELQKGYMLKDRVIRASLVKVNQ